MGYHPRIETAEMCSFLTTRSRNSELWFVNNSRLEHAILGYAAKFSERYNVKLYALAIEGNHVQGPADFPELNRASFMRDFNSSIARAVSRHTPEYPGGRFWARRYSSEFLPAPEDIESRFFYTVLQPVQDGLVEKISDYPGYNCFHDVVSGISRKFSVVRWGEFNAAKRTRPHVSIKDYTDEFELTYERIPGYEELSQQEYSKLMHKKLELKRQEVLAWRRKNNLGFAGKEAIQSTPRGAQPRSTKVSTRESFRPRILSNCPQRRREGNAWYFSLYAEFKECSRRYREGEIDIEFPLGMYRPPQILIAIPP